MVEEDVNNWHSVESLLSDWSQQACTNRATSAKKAQKYRKLHHWLGIPIVIFSSSAGSAAFTQIHGLPNDTVRIIAGVLGIVSAILAGLQTFFRFGETAEKYRVVGIGYEKVETEIEEILALQMRENIQEHIDALREEMNKLANDSPDIPSHDHPNQKL